MTLEYFDGFDDYSTSQMSRYITSQWAGGVVTTFNGGITISSGNGRNSSASLHTTNMNNGVSWTFTSQATRTIGFAFKVPALPGAATSICFFADVGTIQTTLRLNSDGTLGVCRGSNSGTLLSTSSLTILAGVWYYIEFQATINNTTGSYTVKVNGTTYTSGSSINNRSSANNSANQVNLAGSGSGITVDYDDFYVSNDSTFLGDCRVETKLPTGNGTTNNFTRGGTDSGTNWGQVDENPATDDTDYVLTAGAGNLDEYTYPALATASGAVKAVMTVPVMRNDNAGVVTAQSVYRSGGSDFFGASNNIGSTSYAAYSDIQITNPATAAAWTVSEVNAAQFGVKRTA